MFAAKVDCSRDELVSVLRYLWTHFLSQANNEWVVSVKGRFEADREITKLNRFVLREFDLELYRFCPRRFDDRFHDEVTISSKRT